MRFFWVLTSVFSMGLLSGACGDDGKVPGAADASPDADICGCPGSGSLSEENVNRLGPPIIIPGPGNHNGPTPSCPAGEVPIAGSCMATPLAPLTEIGYTGNFDPDDFYCFWHTRESTLSHSLFNSVICLQEAGSQPLPPMSADCECLPVESAIGRLTRFEAAGTIVPSGITTIESSCDAGHVLLGGTCGGMNGRAAADPLSLISNRYGADHATWSCSWNNPTTMSFDASVKAFCMRPPAPDMAPEKVSLVERLELVDNTEVLEANSPRLVDATCKEGDFLVSGSCAIDDPEAHSGITMFRNGLLTEEENRPNTWQCAWNNRTDNTATATATAACLEPL